MSEFKFPDEIEDEKTVTIDVETGDTDTDIEVEIVDDTPEQDRGRRKLEEPVEDPTEEELEKYSSNVQERIKKLTHARHDERRAKESTLREKQELERLTQALMDENKQLKGYVEQGTKQIAASGLSAAEAEMATARRQYKEAQEAFDTDAIIAAQEAMTDAKFNLERAKSFRPAPLQTYSDSVQTQQPVAQQEKPDQKSLRWQAKNQWFGSEGFEDITSYSLGLHQKLVNSGIDPQSDEYYAQIDNSVRTKFPEVFGSSRSEKNQSEKSQRPASVVAPATRSSGPKKIQITPSALALAKKFGLTPQQYAAQVAKLESYIMATRDTRDIVSREKSARKVYRPSSTLPDPDPIPGMTHRWIATHILGQSDPTNVSRKLRDNWVPCKAVDYPEMMLTGNEKTGNIEIGGLMLCAQPTENVEAMAEYYSGQAQQQMDSVDNSFLRQNDPRMPLFSERKSTSTRGGFGLGLK